MKVPRHAHPNEEQPLSIKTKPVFKVAPVLSLRTLSLLPPSPSKCLPSTTITTQSSSSSLIPSNIQSIANTMKLRMKAAVKTMVWNDNNRALLSSLVWSTADGTKSSFYPQQQQQHDQKPSTVFSPTLTSHTLLKQYLSFVQEETGALVDMESSSFPVTDSLPLLSLDHQPHPLASSGATLIESLVCDPMSKMTELYKQNDANQKRPISRSSSSSDTTSNMENDQFKVDETQQIKKSERLRLKQQRQQHKPTSKTDSASTFINHNEKETATTTQRQEPTEAAEATAATTGIRCICDKPHDEFGSMVQCDDCSYWLHLNCLALDEASLDDTYRCPSCYVTLGPGQFASSSTVTWRLAAQLKSRKLASRRGNTKDHGIHKRELGLKHKKSTQKQRRLVQLGQKQQQRRSRHQPVYSAYDDLSCSSSSDSNDEMDFDYQQQQTWMIPKMTIDPSIKTTMTTPTGNVLVQVLGTKSTAQDNGDMDKENLYDSDTTESDCEMGDTYQHGLLQQQGHHRNSIASSSSSVATVPSLVSSPSHTSSDLDSTPDGNNDFYAPGTTKSDSSILSTTASSACLDQESLVWLSRLAYLESLQSSSKQQCFTPHASDVFLCDDQQLQQQQQQQHNNSQFLTETPTTSEDHHYPTHITTPLLASSTRSDPPSTICSHDLSQFSFDTGPFWSPTHHQVTDSCLFY